MLIGRTQMYNLIQLAEDTALGGGNVIVMCVGVCKTWKVVSSFSLTVNWTCLSQAQSHSGSQMNQSHSGSQMNSDQSNLTLQPTQKQAWLRESENDREHI